MIRFLKFLLSIEEPEHKGMRGESRVVSKLNWLDLSGYKGNILRNVYVPRKDGGTTEIDVLFITCKGIFVIESKNYSGYIFGNSEQSRWTETLYAGRGFLGQKKVEKHHFYNPIWQNRTHINYLKRYLGMDIPFYSFIVFSDGCEFKNVTYSRDCNVCYRSDLNREIKQLWSMTPNVLSVQDADDIYERLLPLTNKTRAEKRQHVRDIRQRQSDPMRCPRCGGQLVLRTAKGGEHAGHQFYGCSNYPRCRYIRSI